MKKIQNERKLPAGTPLRTCFLVGLLASSASAQLPTVPTLPNSSSTVLPSAPMIPSLEFHAPIPSHGQLPTEPMLELGPPTIVGLLVPSAVERTELRGRALSMVGLIQRRGPTQLPTAASLDTLPEVPAHLNLPAATLPQSSVVQVQYTQQYTQLDNLPEVPIHLRGSTRTMEHQSTPDNAAGGVAHAYVATDVLPAAPPALDRNGSQQTALPVPDASTSPSDASLLSLVDGFALPSNTASDNTSPSDQSQTDVTQSVIAQVSNEPVIKGPVSAVPLDDQTGSLLDADVTGMPELSSAIRSVKTDKSESTTGTHFSMKDDGDETPRPSADEWHATNSTDKSMAISKPRTTSSSSKVAGSKVEVHETFSSRNNTSTATSPSLLTANADKLNAADKDGASSKSSDAQLAASKAQRGLKPRDKAAADFTSDEAADKTSHVVTNRVADKPLASESAPRTESHTAPVAKAENPIAFSRPIVQAVKQTSVTFPGDTIDFNRGAVTQSSHVVDAGQLSTNYRDLAMQLHQAVKNKFPGSRIDIKSDEEGLVVQGLAASEAEATKILSFVRKASLCPVADQVKTRR